MVKVVAKTKVVDIPSSHGYRSHKNDPSTSRAAEPSPAKLTAQMYEVLENWKQHTPCTAKELAERSGLDYYLCQRRKSDLWKAGYIVKTGKVRDKSEEFRVCQA